MMLSEEFLCLWCLISFKPLFVTQDPLRDPHFQWVLSAFLMGLMCTHVKVWASLDYCSLYLQWKCTGSGSQGPPAPHHWWTWSTWSVLSTWPGPGSFPHRSDQWAVRTQTARHGSRCDRSGTRTRARCSNSYQKPAESFVWGELWCPTERKWNKREKSMRRTKLNLADIGQSNIWIEF